MSLNGPFFRREDERPAKLVEPGTTLGLHNNAYVKERSTIKIPVGHKGGHSGRFGEFYWPRAQESRGRVWENR